MDGARGAADELLRLAYGCALREDVEGRVVRVPGGRQAGGCEDRLKLAGADDGVDLGNVLLDLVAVALDQAAGHDEAAGLAAGGDLVLRHLEDGVDRLLLGRVDEAAGVDDQNLGVLGAGGELGAGVVEQAHHHLGVDEVLGAAERDEAYLGAGGSGGFGRLGCENFWRSHSLLVYQFLWISPQRRMGSYRRSGAGIGAPGRGLVSTSLQW